MKPSDSAFQLALICLLVDTQTQTSGLQWAGLIWAIIGMGRIWKEREK